jgi:low affinity Fe/Cu permease
MFESSQLTSRDLAPGGTCVFARDYPLIILLIRLALNFGVPMAINERFGQVADKVAKATGHPVTFIGCCLLIVIWAASGSIFHYSDTWQLIINTGTTIVTFLMVFLIQNTQNRDSAALQIKLDELIRSSAAHNAFIGIEHLSQTEVEKFRDADTPEAIAMTAAKKAVDNANRKARKARSGL